MDIKLPRVIIMFFFLGILWFLYRVFEPYGLRVLGQAIACFALYGLLVQPLWRLGKFFVVPAPGNAGDF